MYDNKYQIVVGNIGLVLDTDVLSAAHASYLDYINASKDGIGRAAHETVTMFSGGEPILEYYPPHDTETCFECGSHVNVQGGLCIECS